MTKERKLRIFAWALVAAVWSMAFVAWGETYGWRLGRMSIYKFFPLLGLIAFSTMWTHYVLGAIRRFWGLEKSILKRYFEATSGVVLVAILLHPGLLAWQLWQDGLGLPPGSELRYVEASARWAIIFGFTALTAFLTFELRRKFAAMAWWRYVEYLSDGAMVLIFFHALKLGGALQLVWFQTVWYFYGMSLAASIAFTYYHKHSRKLLK